MPGFKMVYFEFVDKFPVRSIVQVPISNSYDAWRKYAFGDNGFFVTETHALEVLK